MRFAGLLFVVFLAGCSITQPIENAPITPLTTFTLAQSPCQQDAIGTDASHAPSPGHVEPASTECPNVHDATATEPLNADTPSPQTRNHAIKDAVNRLMSQRAAICLDKTYAAICAKTTAFGLEVTDSKMVDKSTITAAEKEHFVGFFSTIDRLNLDAIRLLKGSENQKDADVIKYMESIERPAILKNRGDLYEGRQTWGEYNRRRKQISDAELAERRAILAR